MPNNSKIIFRVVGGLGNQLFIYAFARSVGIKYNVPVSLETHTGFIKDPYKRNYCLNKFNIHLENCSRFDSLYYPLHKRFQRLTKIIYGSTTYYTEQDIDLNSLNKILIQSNKIFLDGYWQKENYFSEYIDIIRKELSLKRGMIPKNQNLAGEMNSCNSVAVHLRRVMYDNVLGLDYYLESIKKIERQIENPVFYIFSDDIEWCKNNFKLHEKLIFINHNGNDDSSELWLMSQCKHFIIANSTFSWWGAMLSIHPQKIIIKP